MVPAGPTRDHAIGWQAVTRLEFTCTPRALVYRREIDARQLEQFVEIADHEIGFLKIVDPVARTHHTLEIEADAVRRRIVEREQAFRARRRDPRAIDAQAVFLLQQPELDRVPVDTPEMRQHAQALRAQ